MDGWEDNLEGKVLGEQTESELDPRVKAGHGGR